MPDNDEPKPQSIIKNCHFKNMPEGGIERLIPNDPDKPIRIENCRFEGDEKGGIQICLTSQTR